MPISVALVARTLYPPDTPGSGPRDCLVEVNADPLSGNCPASFCSRGDGFGSDEAVANLTQRSTNIAAAVRNFGKSELLAQWFTAR